MRKLLSLVLIAAIMVSFCSSGLNAAPPKEGEKKTTTKKEKGKKAEGKKKGVQSRALVLPKGIELSDEQEAKVKKIRMEFMPKIKKAMEATNSVMTPEVKKKMAAARKEAAKAGKKGKEAREAVMAAAGLTAEQEKAMNDAQKEITSIRQDFMKKVSAILTDEQKAKLPKQGGGKKKKKKDE